MHFFGAWLAVGLPCFWLTGCGAPPATSSAPIPDYAPIEQETQAGDPPATSATTPIPTPDSASSGGPAVSLERAAPPIGGDAARALSVPGFADAVLHVPTAATSPRPVLVATHGNYDTPDYQCHVWGKIVEDRAFVLCPRGIKRSDSPSKDDPRFEYASNHALEKEIDGGLHALRAAFPGAVAPGSIVFTGFSLGAIMGVTIAARRPELFSGLVLIEGGDKWTIAAAKKLAAQNTRVLFACSQPSCSSHAKTAVRLLAQAGVDATLVSGRNEGHTYGGSVRVAYAERFPWIVEQDPRWRAP